MNKNLKFKIKNLVQGVSLIEILVVIAAFAVLGILVSRSVLLTVQGARKSEAIVRVRENLNYAMSVIQRQIRNANTVTATPCDGSTSVAIVSYTDQNGQAGTFSCMISGADSYIASGSGRLTSTDVVITNANCNVFVCIPASGNIPPSINVSITAQDSATSGIEGAQVTSSTKIYLRTY